MTAHEPTQISVTITEACKLTGLGRTKLYDEISSGRLPIRKVGTRTIIRVSDLKAFVDALPTGGPKEVAA